MLSGFKTRELRLSLPTLMTLMAIVILVSVGGWQIMRARDAVLAEGQEKARNLSRSLAQHAARTIEGLDLVLSGIVEHVERNPDRANLNDYLQRRDGLLEHSRNLIVTDAEGHWAYQASTKLSSVNVGDRPYFRWHREHTNRGLHIDTAVASKADGLWVLPLSRRFDSPDGAFGGIVLAALQLNYLTKFYETLSIGEKGAIGLWNTNGSLVARHPASPGAFSRDHTNSPILLAARREASGVFVGSGSQVDGVPRIVGYEQLPRYPFLIVSASLAVDEVMAPWRREALFQTAIMSIAALALAGIALILEVQIRQARASAEALARSEALHRLLSENSNDMIAVKSTFDGACSYVSPASVSVIGWTPKEFEALPVSQYVHGDDQEQVRKEYASLTSESPLVSSIHRVKHKEGYWIWVETVFRLSGAGTPDERVIVTARDITVRRQAEEALKTSEARYRLLAEAATDMIVLTDLDGVRRYISPASQVLLGYGPEELVGTRVVAMGHPEDAERLAGIFSGLREGLTEQASTINRLRRKDGSYVWVEAKLKLVRDENTGQPCGIICAVRDISERHRQAEELRTAKEAAETAAEAKSEFLASMSHELRTPLNAIIGFSRLMVDERDLAMPVMRRYARLVQDASTTLLTIVNDVLDVSKLEGGNLDLNPHPFSPRDLVESVATLLRGEAEGKGLALHVEADPGLPSTLIGDDARLRQVLLNLLSNAVKFTAKGVVRVFVGCEGEEAGIARVRFSVMDTGIGIPQDKHHRLFKRFSQVDSSTARQFGGTGLGLSICKSLVEVMGGSIVVDSVEGEGTTFSFVLDLTVAAPIVATSEPNSSDPAALALRGAHILLAEDVEMNQELAVAMLTRWGHTVEVVSDGAAAVDAVRRSRYDLVLMDVQMPVMDGIEATRRIRSLGARYATLPIVAMTANVMLRDVALCREAGVDDHIGKPFVPESLRQLVERMTAARDMSKATPTPPDTEAAAAVLDAAIFDDIVTLVGPAGVRSLLLQLQIQLECDPLSATGSAALRFAAHALVSSSGMLGFRELSQTCRILEHACDGEDIDSPPPALPLATAKAAIVRARMCLKNRLEDFARAQAA